MQTKLSLIWKRADLLTIGMEEARCHFRARDFYAYRDLCIFISAVDDLSFPDQDVELLPDGRFNAVDVDGKTHNFMAQTTHYLTGEG